MSSSQWATVQLLLSVCVLTACMENFEGAHGKETVLTKTFRSPGFKLGPGKVINRYFTVQMPTRHIKLCPEEVIDRYIIMQMPTGHIAVCSLDMNFVTVDGTPVPLSETYLHHWVLLCYYLDPKDNRSVNIMTPAVPNANVCNRKRSCNISALN